MFFPIEEWLPAFALTVLVEAPIVLYGFRNAGLSLPRLTVVLLAANLATHQAVWFVYTQLFLVGTTEYLVVAETWAAVAEAIIYWAVMPAASARRVVAIAVAANAASFVIGQVVRVAQPDLLRLPT